MNKINNEIERLEALLNCIKKCTNFKQKKLTLLDDPNVCFAFERLHLDTNLIDTDEKQFVVITLIAIGQVHVIDQSKSDIKSDEDLSKLIKLIQQLVEIEDFYKELGGLIGYQLTVLKLIASNKKDLQKDQKQFYQAQGTDISQLDLATKDATVEGLKCLPEMAEVYPIGGVGDRLSLIDENGEPLPTACLKFLGRSLLEGLIRDVQAREFLYYKVFENQVTIPVAMMTSREKNNHAHIYSICEKNKWFGRSQDSFRFFCQISVPVVTKEGLWSTLSPYELNLKPGGHGVIWKLAQEKGVFDWLHSQNKNKLLVRQINNPIAGMDYGLVAFFGVGCIQNKSFGLASCQRQVKAAEGVLVLAEEKNPKGNFQYTLSNIEYTDFENFGIEDVPKATCLKTGNEYSLYPANTNILFMNLEHMPQYFDRKQFPGLMINMKTKVPFFSSEGEVKELEAGRLETMMQNISDEIIDHLNEKAPQDYSHSKTYLTYNERRKTISTTKKSYEMGKAILETPEGAFYDYLVNCRDLLIKSGFILPQLQPIEDYIQSGPNFLLFYQPALGPFYQIIAQKLRGGKLSQGSELQLEVAEIDMESMDLSGSLVVLSHHPLGHLEGDKTIYSNACGKCSLKNVKISNQGIDYSAANCYWKNYIKRKECLTIELGSNSEFYAKDIIFEGSQHFSVPANEKWEVFLQNGCIYINKTKIEKPSWFWKYYLDKESEIKLVRSDSTQAEKA